MSLIFRFHVFFQRCLSPKFFLDLLPKTSLKISMQRRLFRNFLRPFKTILHFVVLVFWCFQGEQKGSLCLESESQKRTFLTHWYAHAWKACNFIKKRLKHRCSYEICEIFKDTYFKEHLRTAASIFYKISIDPFSEV